MANGAVDTPVAGNTSQATSAKAELTKTLGRYGLASLGDFAWREYLAGIPIEQIMLDIRDTAEYKARFPAMEHLAQTGHAVSEAEYIGYETTATSIFKAAGLPAGFYDQPDDFTHFLTNNIGLPELQSRVDMAKTAVYNADPDALAALEDFYSVGGRPESMIGDLTAYFLDDTRALPLIQTQWISAQNAAAAKRTGYGEITRTEAERLAALGVTGEQAQSGFGTLASMQELFTNLPGENPEAPTREQGQAAVFENDATARRSIERQQRRRKAPFQQGGGFSQEGGGVTGIG
jgi:hypothetical protein